MKIFIVLNGSFLVGVFATEDEAEDAARTHGLKYATHNGEIEFRFEQGTEGWKHPRKFLHYRDSGTKRWNNSGHFITSGVLGD